MVKGIYYWPQRKNSRALFQAILPRRKADLVGVQLRGTMPCKLFHIVYLFGFRFSMIYVSPSCETKLSLASLFICLAYILCFKNILFFLVCVWNYLVGYISIVCVSKLAKTIMFLCGYKWSSLLLLFSKIPSSLQQLLVTLGIVIWFV